MMARISEMNRRRVRSVLISREFKQVFMAVPAWIAMLLARPFVGWLARAMFLAPDGQRRTYARSQHLTVLARVAPDDVAVLK